LNVVIRASDGKSTSEPFTVHITVVLPSAVPLITAQSLLIIDEDNTLTLEYEHLKVSDADDPYPVGFTMNIQPGLNYTVDDRLISPALNFNGFLDVGVTVNDGEKTSEVFPLRIYVVPINDAPEITILESDPISYEPGTGPISITEEFEAVDVDNDFLQLAQITLIDSNYSSRNDELIFENSDTSPIRGVYDASKGVLALLGYATIADYIAAIRSIKYNYLLTLDNNGKQTPISTTPKKVSISLSDGQLASDPKQRVIELKTSVELSIPNTFTPNGDSENNTWAVQPLTKSDQFDDTIVRVYNKRGLLVYESVGLEKQWDGTFNGELLPVDTYYYTIDLRLSFTNKTYKGAVMILR
jgi:gliding motility-associated-like protein